MPQEKNRRKRRTIAEVEKDILNAVSVTVGKYGFSNVTLSAVAKKAKVELSVIYRHFGSLDGLLDRYVQEYDLWLNNSVDFDTDNVVTGLDYYLTTADAIVDLFYENKHMQQLLLWELTDVNPTTEYTSTKREEATAKIIEHFEQMFQHTPIDIRSITAVMVAGVYLITLHKDVSTFCGVDFSTVQGKQKLINALKQLSTLIFNSLKSNNELKNIARKLYDEGVNKNIILRVTGVLI